MGQMGKRNEVSNHRRINMNDKLTISQCDDLIKFLQTAADDFLNKARKKLDKHLARVTVESCDLLCLYGKNAWYTPLKSVVQFTFKALRESTYEELLHVLGHELGHHVDYTISSRSHSFFIHNLKCARKYKHSMYREFLADELSVTVFDVPAQYGIKWLVSSNNKHFFEDSDTHPCTCERIIRLVELLKKDKNNSNCSNDVLYYNILTGGDDYEHTSRVSKQIK